MDIALSVLLKVYAENVERVLSGNKRDKSW